MDVSRPTGAATFPVVGIGASAGGLEALEQLFRSVPPDSGASFVVVPHLDPTHPSLLSEILQRITSIPIVEATDQMPVEPNRIQIIPPNRDLGIFHGRLQLSAPAAPHGQRMPVDSFLRSLAEDQGDQSVGIILSGTGTDGTLGLRAILGAGGVPIAQDPATAKYEGMPTSAITAGYAVHVLPPDRMWEVIRQQVGIASPAESAAPALAGGLDQVLMLLRSRTGHDFGQYKKSTVGRRIERRMSLHGIDDTRHYARFLKENPAEVKQLFKELLINVTSFFRDPEAYEALRRDVLPGLLLAKPEGEPVRVWVAGCATGEEAYSMAILLREFLDEHHRDGPVQIYATDLDDDAIAIARTGAYPPNIVQDVLPDRLRRFFVKDPQGYRVKKEIREMVVFAVQNAVKDPPFTRLDLLCCRNLMIYMEPELQDRLLATLHYALRPDGVLFLSPSESVGTHASRFVQVNRRWKIYRALQAGGGPPRALTTARQPWTRLEDLSGLAEPVARRKDVRLGDVTRHALLQAFAPPSVLTDVSGNILYFQGDTGRYLSPAAGRASLDVVEMARDGLQVELRAALHEPWPRKAKVLVREALVRTNGSVHRVAVEVRRIRGDDATEPLLLISFRELERAPRARGPAAAPPSTSRRVKELTQALAHAQEQLRTVAEDQQASTEEFKSMNEELQSTNEELQSTNEELETSKEELQSVNEELVTVNGELHAKVEQLAGVENDMRNLFDSIGVGIVFLDRDLAIRRFTRDATRIFRAVATDVGRPLADIKCDLPADELLAAARQVLETLVAWERELTSASGSTYLVRIQAYRTLDDVIEGVVMAFTDISTLARAEATAEEEQRLARGVASIVREPLAVLDEELRITWASRGFFTRFGLDTAQAVGRSILEVGGGAWDLPALRELLDAVRGGDRTERERTLEGDFPGVGRTRLEVRALRVPRASGTSGSILLAIVPVVAATGG